ncbi:MAG: hypothetical protein H0U18_06075 [Pyrinomonadaceae bacterium]|nr:hypothetical protein [Pyrinomonadaceae bacterium]
MKARNRITKALALGALVISLAIVAAIWDARRADAIGNPDLRVASFGLVSLGAGQTARLNAANTQAIGDAENSPGDRSRARRVTLAFDIYGVAPPEPDSPDPTGPGDTASCTNNLRLIRRESCTASLMPGEATSFDIGGLPEGTQIHAILLGGPDTRVAGPEPHIAPTLGILEGARTVFTHPALRKGFNPQPDPPGQQQ